VAIERRLAIVVTVSRLACRGVKRFGPALLVLRHASWEAPHRILDACGSLAVTIVDPLEGDPLPDPAQLGGVLAMGGPMNVDETDRYPQLTVEREWLANAVNQGIPVLGICLGAQLLARALGARVRPGERTEIGFAPVTVSDSKDPILGDLAPHTNVLHWHGDVMELPEGATLLASSAQTEIQAFRHGNAWGVLFHPEADARLLGAWLSVPQMAAQAIEVLGSDGVGALRGIAGAVEEDLMRRSAPGFRAFAAMVERSKAVKDNGFPLRFRH
jgi:GMP synthase (glutamine-hydrolysing)